MSRSISPAVWLGSAALAALAGASVAEAGGFAIREQSAYGQGSSFAGIAAGGSLSSMFWNPATIADVEGAEIEAVVSGVIPITEVDVDAFGPFPSQDEGDIGEDAVVPAGYGAYRINEHLILGLGVNGPFGLITRYDDDSILRAAGIAGTSKVFSINANPVVAFQVNDWLAVAAGAQIQWIDVKLSAQSLGALGVSELEGDDYGFGFTAGVLLTPMPGTEIGIGYRSFIDHELEGTLETGVAGEFDIDADGLDLPDLVTIGIRQKVTDRIRVMAGAEWSNWSRFEEVDVSGVEIFGAPVPIDLPFEYNDGWFFSAGAEYDINPQFTVRAGVGYELSPLDDGNRTFRLPDNDRLWLSAGASYNPNERFSVDLGYSYIMVADTDIDASEDFGGDGPIANGPFSGEADADAHIISGAFKVKFGGAPPPAPPMIVKP
jgi:long-chain fatty acid transport protein